MSGTAQVTASASDDVSVTSVRALRRRCRESQTTRSRRTRSRSTRQRSPTAAHWLFVACLRRRGQLRESDVRDVTVKNRDETTRRRRRRARRSDCRRNGLRPGLDHGNGLGQRRRRERRDRGRRFRRRDRRDAAVLGELERGERGARRAHDHSDRTRRRGQRRRRFGDCHAPCAGRHDGTCGVDHVARERRVRRPARFTCRQARSTTSQSRRSSSPSTARSSRR